MEFQKIMSCLGGRGDVENGGLGAYPPFPCSLHHSGLGVNGTHRDIASLLNFIRSLFQSKFDMKLYVVSIREFNI
jgi:hypothetical protein